MVDIYSRRSRRVREGAPGAGWLVAGIYLFSALVFAAYLEGWGERNPHTAAPPAAYRSTHG